MDMKSEMKLPWSEVDSLLIGEEDKVLAE